MIKKLLPILGITFVDILGFSMLIPVMPYFVTHFGAKPVVVGLLFSTFSFCQLVAGPVWGNISDRIGRKGVLIISQIGATIGWAMLAVVPNIWYVFLARIIEGASGGNISVTQAYVADLVAPKERARAFSYISATFAAGMVFGPLMGGVLFAKFGFSAPFLCAAALQAITLLLTVILLPESRAKDEEGVIGFSEIVKTFRNRDISPVLWQKAALSLALYGWFSVIALYLAAQLRFSLPQTDYFFSIFAVLNVLGNVVFVGRTSDKLGDRVMTTAGIALLVGAFALVPFVHTIWLMVLVMILFSIGMAFSNTGISALISNSTDERRQGTVLGVASSLDSVAGIISPPVSTGLLGKFGSPWAAAESLFFAVVALLLGLRVREKAPHAHASQHAAVPADTVA